MDLSMYRGDTVTLNIVVSAAGVAFPLTGCQVWFTAKWTYSDPDISAIFQKTIGSGIVVTNPLLGMATVVIDPADTSGLPPSKVLLVWDCQVEDSSGNVFTVASGNIIVVPDVTITI